MTTLQESTHASINSTRGCRARPRAPNRPISPRSRPTSGWIRWKAVSSSSKRRRAARRAVSRSCTGRDQRPEPGPGGLCSPPVSLSSPSPRNRPIRTRTHPAVRTVHGALALALALAFAGFGGVANAEDAATQPAAVTDQLPRGQDVSDTVIELAGWVVAAKDNHGYPFAIMDKAAAQFMVFGRDGRCCGVYRGLI